MLMPNGMVEPLWTPQGKKAKVRLLICCLRQVQQIPVSAMTTFQLSNKKYEATRLQGPEKAGVGGSIPSLATICSKFRK